MLLNVSTFFRIRQYALQNKTYKNITVYEKLNIFNPSYTINIFFFFCYRVAIEYPF